MPGVGSMCGISTYTLTHMWTNCPTFNLCPSLSPRKFNLARLNGSDFRMETLSETPAGMTHVQKYWTAEEFLKRDPNIKPHHIRDIKSWMSRHSHLPKFLPEEQIILFFHSCYYDMDATKKCMEDYYKLRFRVPQFFEGRDVHSEALDKALRVLHFGIFPRKTPDNYQIVFHKLNNPDPSNYVFNDGFKLLVMMIDAVYAKQGPLPGMQILFDLTDVKLGHITRLPLHSVKKCLEYIQDAIPVRLKGIHVLNVHPIIDKIMLLIKPFLRKGFLSLVSNYTSISHIKVTAFKYRSVSPLTPAGEIEVHFYKENDQEIYKVIPKSCLPKDYGGELESIQHYHDEFIREMKLMRPMFLEEEELVFKKTKTTKARSFGRFDLTSLEID